MYLQDQASMPGLGGNMPHFSLLVMVFFQILIRLTQKFDQNLTVEQNNNSAGGKWLPYKVVNLTPLQLFIS